MQRQPGRRRSKGCSGCILNGISVKAMVGSPHANPNHPHLNADLIQGMTETATVVVSTSEHDIVQGTSGSLLPGTRAKIIDLDGKEITQENTRGELMIQSPSVVLGYLNNEQATTEAFVWDEEGRWMRTGDEVVVTKSPLGNEHFTIVDRLKELIKCKVCGILVGHPS